MIIAENIAKIEERILKTCEKTGRKRGEITLMGVSKFVSVQKMEEAYKAGICFFGESRVQEAAEKLNQLRFDGARYHFIGSLQRNKAKQAALLFDCIQSPDRIELIEELDKQTVAHNAPLEVMLELRTGEDTKSGFKDTVSLCKAAEFVLKSKLLKPAGFMTMAPFTDEEKLIRGAFRQLVKTQEEIKKNFPVEAEKGTWDCLSMGMSGDFEIAIEEGSTLLRIGSAIFKE